MRIIITEEQNEKLLSSLLDDLFRGRKVKYEDENRVVYVGNKLMMILDPTRAIIDNDVVDKVKEVLYYNSMKDFKEGVREWIVSRFKVIPSYEKIYGIQFKNLSTYSKKTKQK